MSTSKAFEYGTLEASTDSFILAREHAILDIPISFDNSLLHKPVSVVGTMGTPPTSPSMKLIIEKIVGHDAIARRAYDIYESGQGGAAEDNWLRAERELLGI
jgi:hypothetical protein